jgi:hypothetical protein
MQKLRAHHQVAAVSTRRLILLAALLTLAFLFVALALLDGIR